MKQCKILCICGSGTVSSAMVAGKLKSKLAEHGWEVHAVEASPNGVQTAVAGDKYDLIACVSPVYEDVGVPKVNVVGMLTGLAEAQVINDCLAILEGKAPEEQPAAAPAAPEAAAPTEEPKKKKKHFWQK